MYKLMLVDDESEIREGLREIIRFEELGFTVVGEAQNGIEALQLAENLSPDVILTDIRMPMMDGLTMCREIKKRLPTARFIILSGYDDFEYAQQAIELSSMRYLLKPISSVEFTKILQNVRATLDEEFRQRRDLSALRQNFEASLPLLREMLLSSLVSGGMSVESAVQSAHRYEIELDAPRYALALMRVAGGGRGAIEDPELLRMAVGNIARDVLSREHRAHLFHYNDALAILFLLPDDSDEAFAGALAALERAQRDVEHYLSAKALVGVGARCEKLSQLGLCARQALAALEQSSILSSDQVLCATELEDRGGGEAVADPQTLRALTNAVKTCDKKETGRIVERLVDDLAAARPTPRVYRAYMMDVCVTIMHMARDLAAGEDEPGDFEKTLEALMRCPPPNRAKAFLNSYCAAIVSEIGESRVTSSQRLVNQAVEILMSDFSRADMTIEVVCQRLHISTSYFSVLFKRETKKTFHQYLTDLRMDRAMTLLAVEMARTAEAAEAVGIPDPSYFSYAFKKHFGVSPSQARKRKEA
jgi:two-component system response regulator YesN